ncbi:hypothetical protein IJJ05_00850 [Candidatus Saccharibacteria bacterium]|nr:hypothetical protein [Candidatus Saccharibacteria bacterium]
MRYCVVTGGFFDLFGNFRGYVDFFLLQDLMSEDYSAVKFWDEWKDFSDNPIPQTVEGYLGFWRGKWSLWAREIRGFKIHDGLRCSLLGEGRPDVVARLCMVVDWCIDHPEYTAKIKVIPKKDYPVLMPCEF